MPSVPLNSPVARRLVLQRAVNHRAWSRQTRHPEPVEIGASAVAPGASFSSTSGVIYMHSRIRAQSTREFEVEAPISPQSNNRCQLCPPHAGPAIAIYQQPPACHHRDHLLGPSLLARIPFCHLACRPAFHAKRYLFVARSEPLWVASHSSVSRVLVACKRGHVSPSPWTTLRIAIVTFHILNTCCPTSHPPMLPRCEKANCLKQETNPELPRACSSNGAFVVPKTQPLVRSQRVRSLGISSFRRPTGC
ncbi:hypothetical protein K458DRAFT_127366 [Lentithecium fluviatile CBS 122367]|uniref:Uncharacterized protein n=1 Tax=Lentithecium fluviatile CBS 122367 TaxID=1168545 RepID=A0A6G1JGY3_9PLEO|nr:hypothetical protein K458DRAFT_127366 [Lentithecium fluviatile CBS 122367]